MRITETLGWISIGVLIGYLVVLSINAGAFQLPQCPKDNGSERLAYATYKGDSVVCTYVPDIYGLKRREV